MMRAPPFRERPCRLYGSRYACLDCSLSQRLPNRRALAATLFEPASTYLYKWQTLITGVTAVFAALYAGSICRLLDPQTDPGCES